MPIVHVSSEPNARPEDIAVIEDAVNEFNWMTTGDRNYSPVSIFLRDENSTLLGGLRGEIWGGWLYIAYVWVPRGLRHHGYGTSLVRTAEDEARAKGAHSAYVRTFSFQALPFYEGLGYRIVTELADFPPGHSCYTMARNL